MDCSVFAATVSGNLLFDLESQLTNLALWKVGTVRPPQLTCPGDRQGLQPYGTKIMSGAKIGYRSIKDARDAWDSGMIIWGRLRCLTPVIVPQNSLACRSLGSRGLDKKE